MRTLVLCLELLDVKQFLERSTLVEIKVKRSLPGDSVVRSAVT